MSLLLNLVCLSSVLRTIRAETILCEDYQQCADEQITCNSDQGSCDIHCGSDESCSRATIHCANDQHCRVYCRGYRSCRSIQIYGNSATSLSIHTTNTNPEQLSESTVYCPNNAQCNIECNEQYNQCYKVDIHAQNSQSLDLICKDGAHHICYQINVYCPNNGNCNIRGDSTAASISEMSIYALNGFNDVHITGMSTTSLGSIHCQNAFISSCDIALNNAQCTDQSMDKSCEMIPASLPTFAPSNIPNFSPTVSPTNNAVLPSIFSSLSPTVSPTILFDLFSSFAVANDTTETIMSNEKEYGILRNLRNLFGKYMWFVLGLALVFVIICCLFIGYCYQKHSINIRQTIFTRNIRIVKLQNTLKMKPKTLSQNMNELNLKSESRSDLNIKSSPNSMTITMEQIPLDDDQMNRAHKTGQSSGAFMFSI